MFAVVIAMFKYFPYLLESMQRQREEAAAEQVVPSERTQPVQDDSEVVNLN
jgi:hypothetical protein